MSSLEFTGERAMPDISGDIALEHLHRYAIAQQLVAGKRVLDIASGEGYGSNLLAQVATHVIGVDISEEAVKHASSKYTANNLQFRAGDCTKIPLSDHEVDCVVSFETLEHHDKHDEMMLEFKRVLKPNGFAIISTPDKKVYSELNDHSNPFHIRELDEFQFTSLISKYFKTHTLASQRIVYASAISFANTVSPEISLAGAFHCGNFERITTSNKPSNALYLIAVATDHKLPNVSQCSIFESSDFRNPELAALHSSLSWRITAPIRWLVDYINSRQTPA